MKPGALKVQISYSCYGGAADQKNFSGSCHLLGIKRGKRQAGVMIDCGMVHANFQDSVAQNMELLRYLTPEIIKNIDACVITHIHADHVARLPLLVRYGLECPVYITKPSAILMPVALKDSAYIQQSEARYRKRKNPAASRTPAPGGNVKFRRKELARNADQNCNCNVLYGFEDAENSAKLIKNGGNDYFEWIKLEKGIYLKFYPSGHVLGGAIAVIKVEDAKQDGEPYYIAFSGDLGGDDKLFLSPLVPPDEPIDFWLVESTYGGMSHPSKASEIDQMADLIVRAERESMKILNASFALEKSQEMIFLFSHLVHEEIVPKIPAFLDAPLAKNYTEAYAKFWPTSNFIGQSRIPFNPFNLQANPYFHAVEDSEGSVELSRRVGPCFVIAGSGDAEAGRIRGHYRENISSPKTQIWKTGWAPDDTLNGKLGKKYAFVRMNGVEFPVKAEVHEFLGMSSHRDGKNTAILTARMFDGGERKGIIAIVHGELARAWALKRDLVDVLGKGWNDNIILPNLYEVINIG